MPHRRAPRAHRIATLAAATFAAACVLCSGANAKPKRDSVRYDEEAALQGATLVERLASISQADQLDATETDAQRGAAAAALNAYLLLGGAFASVAREFDVPAKLTYGNVHRLQDALYQHANRDRQDGLVMAAQASYDTAGVLSDWSMRGGDELHLLLEALHLDGERIYGPTQERANEKGVRIGEILAGDSTAVFLVGVPAGDPSEMDDATPPARVLLVFHAEGAWQAMDPSVPPGTSGLVRWTDETAESMLLRTTNAVYWLRRRG